ncbi:glycosyltransferase [Aequorivita echinoideorum]|uniref:Glycosyltransferase family 2 protein n=1 Tax=Aequorivita echinoideorum TaxID=1549647 RepID=A0ABS5S6J8_9FLAO|nr:glycosyltransferase [Aequorivita echinoideorum]MBT0608840.1 glycosyltransferase family 2 protein [Aequorivita echinoideorum]
MAEDTYKTSDLEILVATMHRTSLDFLDNMFSKTKISDFKILIVNQTNEDESLKSSHPNIRVINSLERGLSKSRNLAIKNAEGLICLNVDDDVVFIDGFSEKIIDAYNKHNAEIITFQTLTTKNEPYWDYPKHAMPHNKYISQKTLSIEISFLVEELKKLKLLFDERFGLGAQFEDAENFVFLNDAKKKNLLLYFIPDFITIHPPLSSSDDVATDRLLYAKAAIKTYAYGNLSYLWVFKFVSFIVRKKYVPFSEIPRKIKIGFKSISDYKKTSNEK